MELNPNSYVYGVSSGSFKQHSTKEGNILLIQLGDKDRDIIEGDDVLEERQSLGSYDKYLK